MLESLEQLDEKILEQFQVTTDGSGNHYSALVTHNGNPTRLFINHFIEDVERIFPCILIVRKDFNVHWNRVDTDDYYLEGYNEAVDPPEAIYRLKPQPFTLVYDVQFVSRSMRHLNEMTFKFLANIQTSSFLEITDDYSVYYNRDEIYSSVVEGYKDQRFRQSLFQLKYWILLKSDVTRTDIVVTDTEASVGIE